MIVKLFCPCIKRLFCVIPSIQASDVTMTTPIRYFVNPYDDYKGGEVIIKKELMRDRLKTVLHTVLENQSRKLSDCDGGLYVGLSGVAYAFYYLSSLPALMDKKLDYMRTADELVNIALQYSQTSDTRTDPKTTVGFLLGNVGVHVVAALIKNSLGRKLFKLLY